MESIPKKQDRNPVTKNKEKPKKQVTRAVTKTQETNTKRPVGRPRRKLAIQSINQMNGAELKPQFVKGERVLCFHGPLIYEAKALKSSVTKDKQIKYYIHYAGWNKNWDEWVPENRVLKYNEENVQRQKEIEDQHKSGNKGKRAGPKGKRGDATTSSTPKDGGASSGGSESRASTPSKELNTASLAGLSSSAIRGNRSKTQTPAPKEGEPNKRERDDAKDSDTEELKKKRSNEKVPGDDTPPPGVSDGFSTKVEVRIKLPDELKIWLTDDWEAINRNQRLLIIPAKTTVQNIIDEYLENRKSKSPPAPREFPVDDAFLGVAEYFNALLGSSLLYKNERPQYDDVLQKHPDTPKTKLYGGHHLLRLFVKIGGLLAFSELDEEGTQAVVAHLHEFLRFFARNAPTYLDMENYTSCTPEYLRRLA